MNIKKFVVILAIIGLLWHLTNSLLAQLYVIDGGINFLMSWKAIGLLLIFIFHKSVKELISAISYALTKKDINMKLPWGQFSATTPVTPQQIWEQKCKKTI